MSKRNIGGEFQLEPSLVSKVYNEIDNTSSDSINNKLYSLGRTALYAILCCLRDIDYVSQIALPDYCCSSVIQCVKDCGMKISFFHINEDLYPEIGSLKEAVYKSQAILLINYFGLINLNRFISMIRKEIPDIKIIEDDVQNFYKFGDGKADFFFNSYRKWFAVTDGAEVIVADRGKYHLQEFDTEGEYVKYKFTGNLLKSYSNWIDEDFCLDFLSRAESIIDTEYRHCMSKIGFNLFKLQEIENAANKRKMNSAVLHEGLVEKRIRHIYNSDAVPMFVPILLENKKKRDEVRRKLRDHRIFCPVHWPVWNTINCNSLYDIELSLICDQRYNIDDMMRILEIL